MSEERPKPTVYVGDRGSGKTTALLAWVLGGERTARYPNWNRILVVAGPETELRLRPRFHEMAKAGNRALGVAEPEWGDLDYTHRVLSVEDFNSIQRGHNLAGVEVRFDGLELTMHGVRQPIGGTFGGGSVDMEVDVREVSDGMTLAEYRDHAKAADERFRALRDAIDDHRHAPEGAPMVLDAQLYAVADRYAWTKGTE